MERVFLIDTDTVLLRDSGDLGSIDGARRVPQRRQGPRQQPALVRDGQT